MIVMHYCESGDLSTAITNAKSKKTTFPENQIVKWVVQLALALHFIHENKFIHRDLKPQNVMLMDGGEILKLADFGLMSELRGGGGDNGDGEERGKTEEAGTPYYTAPEMIEGKRYSFPADCWAFGVILYQLLSLERPFQGTNTNELVKAILTEDINISRLSMHYSDEIRSGSMLYG
jgi:NIMA (never in mitosis gene a)-related kinase